MVPLQVSALTMLEYGVIHQCQKGQAYRLHFVLAVEGPAKKDTGETLVGQVNTSFESFVISFSQHFSIF